MASLTRRTLHDGLACASGFYYAGRLPRNLAASTHHAINSRDTAAARCKPSRTAPSPLGAKAARSSGRRNADRTHRCLDRGPVPRRPGSPRRALPRAPRPAAPRRSAVNRPRSAADHHPNRSRPEPKEGHFRYSPDMSSAAPWPGTARREFPAPARRWTGFFPSGEAMP